MTKESIIAYLLEELPEEDSERFEDECFAGEEWPTEINLVEEDLIDDYLRGELTPERRQRFEQNYLNTDARIERVGIAAALLRHAGGYRAAAERTPAAPSGKRLGAWFGALWGGRLLTPRAALTFALLLAAVVASVFWVSRLSAPSERVVVMLTLTPAFSDRSASADVKKVKLPPDAGALRISLTLPEGSAPSARYRVEFEDGGGKIVSLAGIAQEARSVAVVLPTARLARGTYALRIFAVTPDEAERRVEGSYLFAVE